MQDGPRESQSSGFKTFLDGNVAFSKDSDVGCQCIKQRNEKCVLVEAEAPRH